jgi:hypothetical protein
MKPRLALIVNLIRVQDPQTRKFAAPKGWCRQAGDGLFQFARASRGLLSWREISAATAPIEGRGPVVITIPLVLNIATFLGAQSRCRTQDLERAI